MIALRTLPHRLGFEIAGRTAVRRGQSDHDVAARVRGAISRTLRGELDAGEQYWCDTIEALRVRLRRDATTVTYVDFGTANGSADEPRTVTRTLAEVVRDSVPPHEGQTLFNLVRALRPESCLELGTCLGISSAYIAAALDLNETGKIMTMEGGRDLARVASINFTRMKLSNIALTTGRFDDNLQHVLSQVAPVDFVHVDGHHDGEAAIGYFDRIAAHTAGPSVFVFDDIRWSRDMHAAWKTIASREQVSATYDLFAFGICVINGDEHEPS